MSSSPRRDAQNLIVEFARTAALEIRAAELAAALEARTAPGIAPIAPAELEAWFKSSPARAWQALAGLTEAQLINQAIEYTTAVVEPWAAARGTAPLTWGDVLYSWQRKLAAKAAA